MAQQFPRTLTKEAFDFPASVSVETGKFTEVCSLVVPASQIRFFGNRRVVLGVEDRPLGKVDFQNSTPNRVDGLIRLTLKDANRVDFNKVVREDRSEDISANGVRIGFGGNTGNEDPSEIVGVGKDSIMAIEIMPDSNDTISKSDSNIAMPITIRTL